MPIKRSGRSVIDASRVIEIDDVFVANIAIGFNEGQSLENILRLTSSFSVAASMTRSLSAKASKPGAGFIRLKAASRAGGSICFRSTWRARLPAIVASPALICASEISLRATSMPASAQTWAIPVPIWPAPITPIFFMSILFAHNRNQAGRVWQYWYHRFLNQRRNYIRQTGQSPEHDWAKAEPSFANGSR